MKWLHNLLKGMSLTAALFVFQACYGTPPGYPEDYDFPEEKIEEAVADVPETPPVAETELSATEFPAAAEAE